MSRIRSALALFALGLFAIAGHAQTNPAVSTIVAFSLSNPVGNLVRGADGALYGVGGPGDVDCRRHHLSHRDRRIGRPTVYQLTPDDAFTRGRAGARQRRPALRDDQVRPGRADRRRRHDFPPGHVRHRIPVMHRFAGVRGGQQDFSLINTNGALPEAELVEGADGYLYGVTRAGGPNGTGTIFKIARDGTDFGAAQFRRRHATTVGLIVDADGAPPVGPLVAGADDYFYGTTRRVARMAAARSSALPSTARVSRSCINSARRRLSDARRVCRERGRRGTAGRAARRQRWFPLRRDRAGGTEGNRRHLLHPGGWLDVYRPAYLHGADGAVRRGTDGGDRRQALRRDVVGRRRFGRRARRRSARYSRSTAPAPISRVSTASMAATARRPRASCSRRRPACSSASPRGWPAMRLRHDLPLQPRRRHRDRQHQVWR